LHSDIKAVCVFGTQVLIGGGENHRLGLFDMVLIKDNHIAVAGGVANALDAVAKYLSDNNLDVGVEVCKYVTHCFVIALLFCYFSGILSVMKPLKADRDTDLG
jgi:hypothetical protein